MTDTSKEPAAAPAKRTRAPRLPEPIPVPLPPREETAVEVAPEPRSGIRDILAVTAIALVIIVIMGLGYLAGSFRGRPNFQGKSPSIATKPVSNVGKGPTNNEGGYDYTLRYLPHMDGAIIDSGFPAGATPEQKKQIVARAAAHDPFVLWYALTRYYHLKGVPNMEVLEERADRVKWHQKLLVLIEASDFTSVSLEGQTFFNEGVNGTRQVTASSTTYGPGVRGTVIRMGGTETTVKDTCVNIQSARAPGGAIIVHPTPPPPPKQEVKGPDTTHGAARQPLRDQNAVRTGTPGYGGSGSAEGVVSSQESQPSGGTNPTPHGTPSGGIGSAPPASSNDRTNPGGASDPPVFGPGAGQDQNTMPAVPN